MVFSTAGFARVFPEKRLELKSLKGRTKAEELGGPFSGKTYAKRRNRGGPRVHRGGTDPLLKYNEGDDFCNILMPNDTFLIIVKNLPNQWYCSSRLDRIRVFKNKC